MRKALALVCIALLTVALVGCEQLSIGKSPTTPTKVTDVPVIVKFDADATRLGPPNGATLDTYLRWSVTGDGEIRCRIDQTPGQPIGDVPITGSAQVRPGVTTMYTLTCTNPAGTVARSLTIIVG